MHGEAVLEAMHPARVLGYVAADAASDLRRRIRRVVKLMRSAGLGDGQIAHARLHAGGTIDKIDL